MKAALAAAILALAVEPAFAHRLDEYLQGTILSVGKDRLQAQMMLTPGVAVFPLVIGIVDTDGNEVISEAEQRNYAERVLRDLSLAIDGHPLVPRLVSIRFPTMNEMKEGRGEIELDFTADLPPGGRNRKFTLENRHQPRFSVYQVNSLVPSDADIRITAQTRNYSQSRYQLEYLQTDVRQDLAASVWSGPLIWLSPMVSILLAWLTFRWRPRVRSEGRGC
jgi:hypothetical protein